jgi:alpha-maltose-1-phosphate synthase
VTVESSAVSAPSGPARSSDVRGGARVLVHHPGSNRLAYNLVAALQHQGFDCQFETGYFYREQALSAVFARALNGRLGAQVTRQLKRRYHPDVDLERLGLRPLSEMVYVGANTMLRNRHRLDRVMTWRNEVFDAAVARQVGRQRPNIVVGHDGAALLSGRAARRAGGFSVLNQVAPHVEAAIHLLREEAELAPEFTEADPAVPDKLLDRMRREIAEADQVLVPSEFVRDSLTARGADRSRISVLPYGIDIDRFYPPPKGVGPGMRILFVGHIGRRKGVRYLLEAVRRLAITDLTVTMIGPMMCDPAALEPWRGLFQHVPHVPFHEVPDFYRDSDVFVFPSLLEGSAFVTYEALASGLPVITTPNAGSVVRDGEDGIIVPIRDVEALMAAIERIYRDPSLRDAMARKARARAEEFTWHRYGERLAKLLDGWLAVATPDRMRVARSPE